MNEYIPQSTTESVWWINTPEQLGRIERVKKLLFETAKRGAHRPKTEIPFSTSIPAEDIESLADDRLKDALNRQLIDVRNNNTSITIPVATHEGREHTLTWIVPRRTTGLSQSPETPIPGQ